MTGDFAPGWLDCEVPAQALGSALPVVDLLNSNFQKGAKSFCLLFWTLPASAFREVTCLWSCDWRSCHSAAACAYFCLCSRVTSPRCRNLFTFRCPVYCRRSVPRTGRDRFRLGSPDRPWLEAPDCHIFGCVVGGPRDWRSKAADRLFSLSHCSSSEENPAFFPASLVRCRCLAAHAPPSFPWFWFPRFLYF